jgi:hypothetical protein
MKRLAAFVRRGTLEKLVTKLGRFVIFHRRDDMRVNFLQVAAQSGL